MSKAYLILSIAMRYWIFVVIVAIENFKVTGTSKTNEMKV